MRSPARWIIPILVTLPVVVAPFVQGDEDALWLSERAELRLAAGDATGALEDFRTAARLNPDSHAALNGMARAMEALGDRETALRLYERAVGLTSTSGWSLAERRSALRAFVAACRRDAAHERAFPALVVLYRENVGTRRTDLELALAYVMRGEPRFARQVAGAMRARYGANEALWRLDLLLADAGASKNRSSFAAFVGLRAPRAEDRQAARATTRRSPGDVAYAVAAEAALRFGDAKAAYASFSEIASPRFEAYRQIGLARAALAERLPETALAHLNAARHDRSVPQELLLYTTGRAYFDLGKWTASRNALHRARAVSPLSTRSDLLLGKLERVTGRALFAAAAYQRVVEVQPGHAEALCELGALHLEMSQMESGRALLLRCVRLHPSGPHSETARRLLSESI